VSREFIDALAIGGPGGFPRPIGRRGVLFFCVEGMVAWATPSAFRSRLAKPRAVRSAPALGVWWGGLGVYERR
jgi:hypothetical protein